MVLPMYVAGKKIEALQIALNQANNELLESENLMTRTDADIRYLHEQVEAIRDAYLQSGAETGSIP